MSRFFSSQLISRLRALPVIGSVHICANGGFPQFRERPPRNPVVTFKALRVVRCMERPKMGFEQPSGQMYKKEMGDAWDVAREEFDSKAIFGEKGAQLI